MSWNKLFASLFGSAHPGGSAGATHLGDIHASSQLQDVLCGEGFGQDGRVASGVPVRGRHVRDAVGADRLVPEAGIRVRDTGCRPLVGRVDVACAGAASVLRPISALPIEVIATCGANVPCEGRFVPHIAIIH